MRAHDLDWMELVDLEPAEGVLRFAGRRALLLDAAAIGSLRRQLADTLGLDVARKVLMRLGYAHGFRMAEAMRAELPWDSVDEWRDAGAFIHTLQGYLRFESGNINPLTPEGVTVASSFEAEQHLAHFGRSEAPACWMLAGFASGYITCIEGKPMGIVEDRCVARGDAACHFTGRPMAEWGAEAEPLPCSLAPDAPAPGRDVRPKLERTETPSLDEDRDTALLVKSAAMRRVVDLARRAGRAGAAVLIMGESGAGKELVARLVHAASSRAGGPLLAVNCAAITETLFESELFGHARGAFTGAGRDRVGLFEAANGGTLFLDEIGEVPLGAQAKLLRALAERRTRRLGENLSRPTTACVIAATNRDLAAEVRAGRFRADLYFRLKVVEIRVPPLRARREDILPLSRAFLARAARRAGRKLAGLTPRAAEALVRHAWPGNVRELENAMEHAVALAPGKRVDLDDLPDSVRAVALAAPPVEAGVRPLREIEREYILAALAANGGNQARTAQALGIGASTLYRKLQRYAG